MDKKNSKIISLVIPVFNESEVILKTIKYIEDGNYFGDYDYEIIIVNDGSTDDTWDKIEYLSQAYSNIRGISFSRNFGKEAAILSGLAYANGDAVITFDADLQHPPETIRVFIKKWEEGVKVVEGIKSNRGKENKIHGFFASRFYSIMSHAVDNNLTDTSDFKLLDRDVVNVILKMPEKQMFYRAITSWVGFSTTKIEYEVHERISGKTKWSTVKLISYAIRNITSFTTAPLQIITICSILFFALSIIETILALVKRANGTAIEGFVTVILLQLISGCIVMFALGLIGYYIAKIYDEVRNRPRYIVEKETRKLQDSGDEDFSKRKNHWGEKKKKV